MSLEPPLVVLAIHPSRYSHDLLEKGQECVLNIPSRPMGEEMVQCGTRSGADVDKPASLGLVLESGRRVSAPWVAGCLAQLECQVSDRITPGDHSLFVAEIVGAWAEEEAFSGTWRVGGQPEDLLPLVHLGGSRFGLLGAEVELT